MFDGFEYDDEGPWIAKAPGEKLDYGLDWNAPGFRWLGDDTIAASEWSVGPELTASDESETDTIATVWLAGGELGDVCAVKNTVTTAAGRIGVRSFRVKVQAR